MINNKLPKRAKDYRGRTFGRLTVLTYSGKQDKNPNSNGYYIHNGIDRIDSSKGYILDNIVPCCKVCNIAKNSMSKDEFLSWVDKIYNYQHGRED